MNAKTLISVYLCVISLLVVSCKVVSTEIKSTNSDPGGGSLQTVSSPEDTDSVVCIEILFAYNVRTRSGGTNINAICPGDPIPRMVTYGGNYNRNPHWSPDKSQIVFLSDSSGITQIHIIDRDGGNERQLTSGSDLDSEGIVVLPDGSRQFAKILWMPDPDKVAVALHGHEGLVWQTVDVVNGEIAPLDDMVLPNSLYIRSMSLSHDGRRIAYTEPTNPEDNESPVEIFIQDIDGSNHFQLTSTGWKIGNPIWSPDDNQIAFLSSSEYSPDPDPSYTIQSAIYMINIDGSNLHEPFITGLNPDSIAWSPDGKLMAVIAYGTQSTNDLFNPEKTVYTLNTLNIRTGENKVLFKVEDPNYISNLSW
jgi:hypothetical protein